MLHRLDKAAPYALMAILGYLTYSTIQSPPKRMDGGKTPASIGSELLCPKLLKPCAHASPADRDPFEVNWNSYLQGRDGRQAATQPAPDAGGDEQPATTQPVTSRPVPAKTPPGPGQLVGVIVTDGVRLAVIGDLVCRAGMPIGGKDPARCWVLESIGDRCVIIRFGDRKRTLRLHLGRPRGPAKPEEGDGDGT